MPSVVPEILKHVYHCIFPGADTGGARGALAPPHDYKIYDVIKSSKLSMSIIGRFIHIFFYIFINCNII